MIAYVALLMVAGLAGCSASWGSASGGQYHIQTDEGEERYFRYQTLSGQYRKEKRLPDGTVVGTYAWIDGDGVLRQRDYIADSAGYRILRSKSLFVGRDAPIGQAIKAAKGVAASGDGLGLGARAPPTPIVDISPNSIETAATPRAPVLDTSLAPPHAAPPSSAALPDYISLSTPKPPPTPSTERPFALNPWFYSSAPPNVSPLPLSGAPQYDNDAKAYPFTFHNGPTYPLDSNGQTYTGNHLGSGYAAPYVPYDGVSVTNDGFRYYIPRAYHEEQSLAGSRRSGSFGYIDPFGIRRVIYYNTSPGTGFVHKKNNRYVGLNAAPYDPRPY